MPYGPIVWHILEAFCANVRGWLWSESFFETQSAPLFGGPCFSTSSSQTISASKVQIDTLPKGISIQYLQIGGYQSLLEGCQVAFWRLKLSWGCLYKRADKGSTLGFPQVKPSNGKTNDNLLKHSNFGCQRFLIHGLHFTVWPLPNSRFVRYSCLEFTVYAPFSGPS